MLGGKNPDYLRLAEEDFFERSRPITIELLFGNFTAQDKQELFGLPNLTKKQRGALSRKNPQEIEITFSFRYSLQDGAEEAAQETESGKAEQQQFELKLWRFTIKESHYHCEYEGRN